MMIATALLLVTGPLPTIPTSVGTPVVYRDRVEIPFTVGDSTTSAPLDDDIELTIPKWSFAWGTAPESWQVIIEADTDHGYGAEWMEDDPVYDGQEVKCACSWNRTGWPGPSDLGEGGDSYLQIEMDADTIDMGTNLEYVPIGYVEKPAGGYPVLPYDGTVDYAGTSGGMYEVNVSGNSYEGDVVDAGPLGYDVTLTLTGTKYTATKIMTFPEWTHELREMHSTWEGTFIYWK